MRYVLKLAYRGTSFVGWQIQPNGTSVQGELEAALQTVLQQETSVVGCGRTDAGVHATEYHAHFEALRVPENLAHRLNAILPPSICIAQVVKTSDEFHARFDATLRTYRYRLVRDKDPFQVDLAYRYPYFDVLTSESLNAAARLLLEYDEFRPFCKSRSGVEHFRCHLSAAQWSVSPNAAEFVISSNRFLRGMVRLIVGMCLNVASGRTSLDEVKASLDAQEMLTKPWSAPAHGLYLEEIVYNQPFGG